MIADRVRPWRDTRRPTKSIPVQWAAKFKGAFITGDDGSAVDATTGVNYGAPMQAIPDGAPLLSVWVTDAMNSGERAHMERLPIPKNAWVTGGAVPMFDRHWLGVHSDGRVRACFWLVWVEPHWLSWLISFFRPSYPTGAHWECIATGLFDTAGKLVSGDPCTASGLSSAAYIPTIESLGSHVLHLTLSDYAGADGTLAAGEFPRCGDWLVNRQPPPPTLTGDALKMWMATMTYGVRVIDRYGGQYPGGKLATQSGDQWAGSTIARCRIPIEAFQLVTA